MGFKASSTRGLAEGCARPGPGSHPQGFRQITAVAAGYWRAGGIFVWREAASAAARPLLFPISIHFRMLPRYLLFPFRTLLGRTLRLGALAAGLAAAAPAAHAQGVIGTYSFTGAVGDEFTFPVDAQPTNATFSPARRGSGLTPSVSANRFAATGFTLDSVARDTAQYFAFRLTATGTARIDLDSLTFVERRSGTGIRRYEVRSSVDNFATALVSVSVPDDTNTRPGLLGLGAAFASLPTVEFRVYGYGAEATAGTWRVDDVRFVGQVGTGGPVSPPTLSFGAATRTVGEPDGTLQVAVTLLNPSATTATTVQVALATPAGSATLGDDYDFVAQTLTFPAGSSTPQEATLTILDDALAESDENIVLTLRNPSAGAVLGSTSTTTLTITDDDGLPLRTIASVTVNDATGIPTELNQTVRLRGVVVSPNVRTTGGYSVVLVDATGGITLFTTRAINGGQALSVGDSLEASGAIIQFRGLTEMGLDTFALLGSNRPLPAPRVVTVLDESTESELVQINGPLTLVNPAQWTNTGSGFNVDVTDGTNTYAMRIVAATNIFGTPPPTDPFLLIGTGGQFDTTAPLFEGYQILPRSLADIQPIVSSPAAVAFGTATQTLGEGGGTVTIPVTITNPSATESTTVDVTIAVLAGSATAGADYTFTTQTLTFPAGSSSTQNATLTVLEDALAEGAETVRLMLANVSAGASLDSAAFTLTITDNDTTTLQFAAATRRVGEGAGTVRIPVTLLNPNPTQATTVTVGLATAAGSATAGTDYTFVTQTLTFPAGSSAAVDAVLTVIDDTEDESDETVILQLTAPSSNARLGAGARFTLTIQDNDTTIIAPAVAFGSATQTLGEGGGTVTIPVTITNPSATESTTVEVALAVPTGSATLGADYTFSTQTLTFAPGSSTAQNATLTVLEDALAEGAETVRLMLLNVSAGASLDSGAFTLTIIDNDTTTLGFAVAARTVAEDAGLVQIAVRLRNPSPAQATTVEVALAPLPGTATTGSDYTFATQTLTFAAGDTTAQLAALTVLEDSIDENDETVQLTLRSLGAGSQIGIAQFTLTITDNDTTLVPTPTLAFGPVPARVAESAGTIQIPVTLRDASATTATTVQVRLAAPAGSATAGADYTFSSQTLTFAAGDTTRQFATLTIVDDAADEGDETILFALDSASAGAVISSGSLAITIQDNDTTIILPPVVTFAVGTRRELESAGTVQIAVSIANPSATQPTTVQVRASAGTATPGVDYTFAPQVLTFPAGSTATQTAVLTLINDGRVERTESVQLVLDSVSAGAELGPITALELLIQDDDTARVRFVQATRTVAEGVGTVAVGVVLSAPVDTAAVSVTVALATPAGSATAGTDYTFTSPTLTFAAGDTTAQLATLTLIDDAVVEPTETVVLALVGTSERLVVTILDNDTSVVQFGAAAVTVPESAGVGAILVSLTTASTDTVRVDVVQTGGTATAGADYSFVTQTLVFVPGALSQITNLTIINDATDEPDETIVFTLQNPTGGAVVGPTSTFTVTIADDDAPAPPVVPLITIGAATVNDAAGVAVLLGQAVRVRGIVTGPNIRTAGYQTSLQDAGDGIGLFRSTTLGTQTIAQGDSLEVIGVISQFNGLTQISIDSFRTLAVAQRLPVPRSSSVLNETTESELIAFNRGPFTIVNPAQWTNLGSGFTVDITNGTDTYALRIVRGTDVYGSPVPTTGFNLIGIGGQFDNAAPFDEGYQIIPRSLADFDFVTGTVDEQLALRLALYPNPATERLTIQGMAATATIFDALGRPVLTTSLPGGTATVRVADLPAGVYVVRAGRATQRFVKQ